MSAELIDICVDRAKRRVLTDVTLACPPGRITAFCGPNGAGKTTALSVLTGALAATSGDVRLDGDRIASQRPDALARRRAVVNQNSALNFPFEVHEVVAMGRTPYFGLVSPAADAAAIDGAIEATQLGSLAERNYLTLSGGERQRVNIARALAQAWRGPKADKEDAHTPWLFLDEPTSALDLKYQLALMELLERLRDEGWGIVIVLHDLHLVRRYADKVALFKSGRLIAFGDSDDVLTETSVQNAFDLDAPYPLERATASRKDQVSTTSL